MASTKIRKPKKIRIDGSNSNENNHTIFEEDGTVQPKIFEAKHNSIDHNDSDDDEEIAEALRGANDGYLERVRERLDKNKERDKEEERDRIRAKHKKKRMKEKDERSNEGVGDGAVLATTSLEHASVQSSSKSLSESSARGSSSEELSDDGGSTDDSSDREENDSDFTEQEDLALSLIRGSQ